MNTKSYYSGVLCPLSCLPSNGGIGGFGPETFKFINFLSKTGFTYWQILPLNPLGFGNSPYSSSSVFAISDIYISPELLLEDGLISQNDIYSLMPNNEFVNTKKVDYNSVVKYKERLLNKAVDNYLLTHRKNEKYDEFCKDEKYWLDTWAKFYYLANKNNNSFNWSKDWSKSDSDIQNFKIDKSNADEIEKIKIRQFLLYKQLLNLKSKANELGIKIVGDMAFYPSFDSSEVWGKKELFNVTQSYPFKSKLVAGVPPDYFSSDGQLWGNPTYNWEELEKKHFEFFTERFRWNLKLYDMVRLDHFLGYSRTWNVNSKEKTAKNGKWVLSPGEKIFELIKKKFSIDDLGKVIIAEDLGIVTPEAEEFRIAFNIPTTKVAQFGFDGNVRNNNLPQNWEYNTAGYLGTHDNNTICGFWEREANKSYICKYLYCNDSQGPWYILREVLSSSAKYVFIAIWDMLFLNENFRFNLPGTVSNDNWSLKIENYPDWDKFSSLLKLFGRFREN